MVAACTKSVSALTVRVAASGATTVEPARSVSLAEVDRRAYAPDGGN
jgi:hypothetical protein